MASIDYTQFTDAPPNLATGPVQPEVADLLGIARRGWLFIVAGTILGLVCAMVVLSAIPPVYKASARIAFEKRSRGTCRRTRSATSRSSTTTTRWARPT